MPAPVDEQVQVQLPCHGAVLPFGLRGSDGTSKAAVHQHFLSSSINAACKVAERSAFASARMTSTRLKADRHAANETPRHRSAINGRPASMGSAAAGSMCRLRLKQA